MLVSSIILFINSNFMFSNFSYFIANSFCFSISYEPLSKIGIGIVWKEKKDAICDRFDIHLIGDITYGGKKHNKGNHICFKSADGRKPGDKGVMYDDEF